MTRERTFLVPLGVGVGRFADLVEHQAAHLDETHVERGERAVECLGDVAFEHEPPAGLKANQIDP